MTEMTEMEKARAALEAAQAKLDETLRESTRILKAHGFLMHEGTHPARVAIWNEPAGEAKAAEAPAGGPP